MNLTGTFTFSGPRAQVWELLQDPVVLAKALPGAERLTRTAADRYEGVMKVSLGPLTAARFDVQVALTDLQPPERMNVQVDGKGAVGFTRGVAAIRLEEDAGDRTRLHYTSEVQVGGRVAAVGQRVLESVSKTMMRQALDALERELQARLRGERPAP